MIKYPRNMRDFIGLLRHSQHEVEVLNAIVSAVETTNQLCNAAPYHQKMADIHDAAEQDGRPIRLVKGFRWPPFDIDLVLVTIEHVDVGPLVQTAYISQKSIWGQGIIMVEHCDELATRHGQRRVTCGGDTAIVFTSGHSNARVGSGQFVQSSYCI